MKTTGFSRHLFWSYKQDADLPGEIISRQVILYGEIQDMIILKQRIEVSIIQKVLRDISISEKNRKRINFIRKIILTE